MCKHVRHGDYSLRAHFSRRAVIENNSGRKARSWEENSTQILDERLKTATEEDCGSFAGHSRRGSNFIDSPRLVCFFSLLLFAPRQDRLQFNTFRFVRFRGPHPGGPVILFERIISERSRRTVRRHRNHRPDRGTLFTEAADRRDVVLPAIMRR